MTSDLLFVFAAIGGLLLMASCLSALLRRHFGRTKTLANLNDRIRAWWAMSIAIAIAFLFGKWGLTLLFAVCAFAALREFLTLSHVSPADHRSLAVAFFCVLPLQFLFIGLEWYGLYSIFIPVYVFLLLPILSAFSGKTTNFLTRISELQFGLMSAVYCLSYVPALLSLNIRGFEGREILLIAFLLIVVQLSDVLQYIWGKLLGKHKIAPSLSPSKTWEGFIGGTLSATLIGALLWKITPFSPLEAAALSFVSIIMGFAGGLVMSAIKRDRGVKDWGHAIAGHGGYMDRLDSVIFSAPLFFHLTRYFWS